VPGYGFVCVNIPPIQSQYKHNFHYIPIC